MQKQLDPTYEKQERHRIETITNYIKALQLETPEQAELALLRLLHTLVFIITVNFGKTVAKIMAEEMLKNFDAPTFNNSVQLVQNRRMAQTHVRH